MTIAQQIHKWYLGNRNLVVSLHLWGLVLFGVCDCCGLDDAIVMLKVIIEKQFVWPRERELQASTSSTRRQPLRRARVSPRLPVPDHIPKPPYVGSRILPEIASEQQIHDLEGIARMRAACELAAKVVDFAGTLVRVRIQYFCLNIIVLLHNLPLRIIN